MEDLINRLTNDGEYGSSICLLLYLTNNYTSLHYLDYLDIRGKELDALDQLCEEQSLQYVIQTIRFMRSGFLGIDEIKENLKQKKPIPFIPRLLINGEDWENAYENFAFDFRRQVRNNKGRKSC